MTSKAIGQEKEIELRTAFNLVQSIPSLPL